MIIRYLLIVFFTFINCLLLKKILIYYGKNLKCIIKYLMLFIFISVITFVYSYSISHHLEFYLKTSRAVFIFSEITYILFFISFSLSLIYLKIYSRFKNKKVFLPDIKLKDKYDAIAVVCEQKLGEKHIKINRRDFIKNGALAFPLISMAFTSKGVIEAYSDTNFPEIKLKYKNLPNSLKGLKIAQVSDLHLGIFITLNYWKDIINYLKKQNLDLLLLTGDFVDEYSLLDDAVKVLSQIKPKYGIYSSSGNHEYSRGISPVLRAFKNYNIPYLRSKGKRIKIGENYLFIGGVDDLYGVAHKFRKGYLKKTFYKTIKYSQTNDFKILMSHRYKVFKYSAKNNIELTLSGHSHGGQIGFNGHSLFEGVNGHKHLWGKFQENNAILYVTSGAGHWFPFRINCPTEVPIFTLE